MVDDFSGAGRGREPAVREEGFWVGEMFGGELEGVGGYGDVGLWL